MASLGELSFKVSQLTKDKVDWLSDRIQPFVEFKMPDQYRYDEQIGDFTNQKGKWISFSLGIFLPSTPVKKEVQSSIFRDVEAYDGLIILEDDKFIERYTIDAGTLYYDAIIDLLKSAGISKYNIEYSAKTLPNAMEWKPGTEKRKAINELVSAINYTPIWVDEYGYFTSSTYVSPQDQTADYEYIDDPEMSIVYNGMEEELDLMNVANTFMATFTNVDGGENDAAALSSIYTNNNLGSPTSTVNRGRAIVDAREVENIADQASLDEYIERIAFEASQIYGKIKFETAIMPFHAYQDVLKIRNETLGIDGKYAETSWHIPLKTGASMSHECRKVVDI